MRCAKPSTHLLDLVFIVGILVATAAAVPTSVLVQNSEVTSNIKAANNNHELMTKVKRSSNNADEIMPKESPNDLASAAANKKSSPEVLPPAFNAPAAPQQSLGNNKANGYSNSKYISDSQAAGVLQMPSDEDIINSAIAAGLTAAAVEAAVASGQRDLQQQQQQQLYEQQADEDTPSPLHKRGVTTPQYLYGGLGGAYGYVSGNGKSYGGGSGNGNNLYGLGEYYNNAYLNNPLAVGGSEAGLAAVPNGVWADDMDPSVVYNDMQDEDYLAAPRASSYRNKAYDNLQNILNAEAYPESMALSLPQPQSQPQPQYPSRFYGAFNGNKRANRYDSNNNGGGSSINNRFADMRLKRDTKLTPADMLALVALVEAGERARKDTDTDTEPTNKNYMYPSAGIANAPEGYGSYSGIKNYYPNAANVYDYPANVEELDDNAGTWMEPNMGDYYGAPMNMETIPKYEQQREHSKYGGSALGGGQANHYGFKRFMVAKKKRGMGAFRQEPVAKSSISYNNVNGEKFY